MPLDGCMKGEELRSCCLCVVSLPASTIVIMRNGEQTKKLFTLIRYMYLCRFGDVFYVFPVLVLAQHFHAKLICAG